MLELQTKIIECHAKCKEVQLGAVLQQLINQLNSLQNQKGNEQLLIQSLQYVNEVVINHLNILLPQQQNEARRIHLNYFQSMLEMILMMIPHIYAKPCNSIFNVDKQINCERITLDEVSKTKLELNNFYKQLELGHAYVRSGLLQSNKIRAFFVKNFKALYYISSEQETHLAYIQALTNPTVDQLLTLWRIIDESTVVKFGYKRQLQNIEFKKIIHIPRLFAPITIQSLKNAQLFSLTGEQMIQRTFVDIQKKEPDRLRLRVMAQQKCLKEYVHLEEVESQVNQIMQCNLKSNTQQRFIQQNSSNINCCVSRREKTKNTNNIIIHIHGGGFVSMKSFSHQAYTRQWALKDCIVFSLDYRLAPEFKFPFALDDCWQAYLWIVNFAKCFFTTDATNIILTGDSAGGNLAMGIVYRAIETGQRVPDHILLAYPALNLNITDFVPSSLKSLEDKMIPFSLLLLCLKNYSDEDVQNYYLSPQYAPQTIIDKLPKELVIFVGSEDVLKDASIEFMDRLREPTQKLYIFEGLPHGFQNMALPSNGILAAQRALQMVTNQLKDWLI